MTEQEAIELLKCHNEKCSGCDKFCDDLCKPAVELAISAIEKQIEADEWIINLTKEQVKELRFLAKEYGKPPYGMEVRGTVEALCKAADTIETLFKNLKSERYYNRKQIKPCEILPKEDEKVLVWIEYGTFSGFSVGRIIEDGRDLWDIDSLNGFYDKEVVKAWWSLLEYKPQ